MTEKGQSKGCKKEPLLRWRWRPMLESRTKESNVYIESSWNVLADSGTHLNEPKRAHGLANYLSFLLSPHASHSSSPASPDPCKPTWWPAGFAFPPQHAQFHRVPRESPLGLLARRISSPDAQSVQLSREEVGRLLCNIRIQLQNAALST